MGDDICLSERERTILRGALARFADRIDRVAIFGSRALGRARPSSDIDLVVHGEIGDRDVARLWTMLDESGLAVTVDLVRYRSLGAGSFRQHVDRCAKPLFDRADLIAARPQRRG